MISLPPLLIDHRAILLSLAEGGYELRYPIGVMSYGERVIDVIETEIPIRAQTEQDALALVAIILNGHEPPELPPAPPVPEEIALPRQGYHRQLIDLPLASRLRNAQ